MTRITSQDEMRENLYTFLCWIEEERPETIKLFCTCVFKEFLVTRYPTLKRLRDILIDGSLPNRENAEIGTLASNRLPVTCGDKQGTLYRDKLEKGEPCIRSSKKLLTPMEFEKLGGKHSSKNWKQSILHQGTPLKKLFKQGQLKCLGYKKSKHKMGSTGATRRRSRCSR
ncbi:unnamed protein product [Arctogadus glacialis]